MKRKLVLHPGMFFIIFIFLPGGLPLPHGLTGLAPAIFAQSSPPAQNPPAQNPTVAEINTLSTQVVQFYNAGKYDEALPAAKRAVELAEKSLGDKDVLTGTAASNLGLIYQAQQKYSDAERMYKRALAVYEKVLGTEDLKLCMVLDRLAWMRYAANNVQGAEQDLQRSLKIREKALGPESKETGQSWIYLAQFHEKQGRYDRAVDFYKRAFEVMEKALDPNDRDLAEIAEKCSCAMKLSKRDSEATSYSERAFKIRHGKQPNIRSGGLLTSSAIHREQPPYPAAAKQARIAGAIIVEVMVDETGKVISARTLCGHDYFVRVSEEAARKWTFTPTVFNGTPIRVVGTIKFTFNL